MKYVTPELIEKLKSTFPKAVESVGEFRQEVTVTVKKEFLIDFMRFLKVDKDFQMDMLVDLTAVDYPERNPRFVVVYHLRSLSKRHNLRVKCWAEGEELPSVVDIWKTADHPNQKQYPGQKLYFVNVEGYIYVVPHVIEDEYVFLKTIIPNRKATRDYKNSGE